MPRVSASLSTATPRTTPKNGLRRFNAAERIAPSRSTLS